MTKKSPVSNIQNIWFDSEQVDDNDLNTEQNYNNNAQSSLINNQIGSGILPDVLIQKTLFDSFLVSGLLDGINVQAQFQPSDTNFGNQLEIELSASKVAGKKTVKLAIIGLDFNGNLQYDTFIFKINEKQYTKKHYTNILLLLINDFIGPLDKSFNLGGRLIIKESKSFNISRDPIMVSQEVQPNLFFRDFFVSSGTLSILLASSLPLYNIDSLNISTGIKDNKIIEKNDVSTQIGEKFLATTNNIQKITLLLSVENTDAGQATNLNWHGDLVISIYPLQSVVDCPSDIVPNLAIDFTPSNIPLAQISYNINTLKDQGTILDGNPQPVDFIFSNTLVGSGNSIIAQNYYVVTIKRSGSADQCNILIGNGANQLTGTSRVTTFTGTNWVDLPEDDLWFKVYTDAIKISDGQAYETGHGIYLPKTNTSSNVVNDYYLDKIDFAGTSSAIYTAVLSSEIQKSEVLQDQRTGDDVFSRQQFIPNIQLLNVLDIQNLENVTEPLVIGNVSDKNIKSFDSFTSTILASIHSWTFVDNTLIIKMIDDITDGYRYDTNVLALISYFSQGAFVNAKFIPNTGNSSIFYRISDSQFCSMMYGDVDGNGIIDDSDLAALDLLVGFDLNYSPPLNSQITTDNITTTVVNGYNALKNPFIINTLLQFQVVDPLTNLVIASGADGILVPNPNNAALGNFQSISTDFSLISNIGNLKLVIYNSSNQQNNGSFIIESIDSTSNNIVNIRKLYYTIESIQQMLRSDIDGDFNITVNDGYLLQNYINKIPPFPASILPSSKIGTKFNILKLKIDPFAYLDVANTTPDRNDDFPSTATNRSTSLHTLQDIFINDGYIQSHDFLNSPISFNIVKQFSWEEYLIAVNGNARFVPTIFTSQSGLEVSSCNLDGISCETYSKPSDFDPGKVDVFVPNDLILGNGNLVRPDGYFYKVDFEVGTIILEIPDGFFGVEKTINLFDDFVSDYNNLGITRLGFKAMRFADCEFVKSDALLKDQVRFSVSVQSFSPNTNGVDSDGYEGAIVDGKIGVSMDYASGLLTMNFTNLYEDSVLTTLNTKVQINVYLKKGGFNNKPIFVNSAKVENLLELNSVFSGVSSGNPSRQLNPEYILAFNGVASTTSGSSTVISAFTFKKDDYLTGFTSIKFEAIIETTNSSNAAEIKLFDATNSVYLNLDGISQKLTTNNTSATLVKSDDLTLQINSGPLDIVYEIHLNINPTNGTDQAKCKMAKITILY